MKYLDFTGVEHLAEKIMSFIGTKASNTNIINGVPLSTTRGYFYGVSDSVATDVEKVVSIPEITELRTGQVIIVQPTVTSTVANSTLKLNNFEAYPMIYNNAAITTSTDSIVWNASCPTTWLFDGEYWKFIAHGVDTNTTYTLNYSIDAGVYTVGTGKYAVSRYSLILQKPDGTWEKPTLTSVTYSTAANKQVNPTGFLLNQIKYNSAKVDVGNGGTLASNTVYSKSAGLVFAYSANCGAAPNWEIGDYIYLVGTIGADGLFYLDSTKWWDNALPIANDGKLYIQLGIALTTTDSKISLLEDRPVLYHDGTKICEFKVADNKVDKVSGKGLSTNDYTTEEKTKLSGIATGAEVNVIETVKVNGTAQTVTDKSVDITVPSAVTEATVSGWGFTKNTGTYSKPSGGIPKTDLTNDIQTSLGKADSAIQSSDISNFITKDVNNLTYYTKTTDINDALNLKQNITDNTLQTTNKTIPSAINEVNSIAKGANQALSYGNYSTMITAFNALAADVYNVGQNVMIVTLEVPDLWISAIESTSSQYTYTTDEAFINSLKTNGYVQVGYYRLSALETQKVDLTEYAKTEDIPTELADLSDDSTHRLVTDIEKALWDSKQAKLVSGTNIKTINNASILGSGNITALTSISSYVKNNLTYSTSNTTYALSAYQGYLLNQNKENTSNKVTSISSSSTDTEYPSAKCVYNLTDDLQTQINGKGTYSKPSDGIPKTDLASAVQTSLGKADSALQEHQDISGKENTSNKVTSISSSSTDTQYPSAKCVYDELSNRGTYTQATGQYTTAAWTTGTNTCIWTAPKTGLYIVWAYFILSSSDNYAKIYKQLQLKGTATRIMDDLLFYEIGGDGSSSASENNHKSVAGFRGSMLVYAQQGQTIIPYIHTPEAGIVWNVKLLGLFIK